MYKLFLYIGTVSCPQLGTSDSRNHAYNPYRTRHDRTRHWALITWNWSGLSPKRDWSSRRVEAGEMVVGNHIMPILVLSLYSGIKARLACLFTTFALSTIALSRGIHVYTHCCITVMGEDVRTVWVGVFTYHGIRRPHDSYISVWRDILYIETSTFLSCDLFMPAVASAFFSRAGSSSGWRRFC